jgi:hypothetical protein
VSKRRDTAQSLEINRICALPIIAEPSPEVVEEFCRTEVQAEYFDQGFRLFGGQVNALLSWDLYSGAFCPLHVGAGKALVASAIPDRAFKAGESKRSMIFVPPQVYEQFTKLDIPWARRRMGYRIPFHFVQGKSKVDRSALARSGKVGCYVMSYSLLSTTDADDLLDWIKPDLIVLDEAHLVKSTRAARTRRLRRYIDENTPRCVVLSGTITTKSIRDYHHLLSYALRDTSPLPESPTMADSWAYVLDPVKDESNTQGGAAGPLIPLLEWARHEYPSEKLPPGVPGLRKAFRLRLTSAPGVVSSSADDLGVSLTFTNRPVPEPEHCTGYAEVLELMKQVDQLWTTPSGDEFEAAFQKWTYMNELTSGFYHWQRWPNVEELPHLDEDTALEYIALAQEHHSALNTFHSELRKWIKHNHSKGLDTPLLVKSNMARNGARDVSPELYALWSAAKNMEFEGMPERISQPVRVCSYKIDWAVKVAEELGSGILWYHHDPIGEWLIEALTAAGLEPLYCPSESRRKGSNERIADPKNKDRIIVAAIGGHGTGKNLQHHVNQVVVQTPRQAHVIEQLMGRLHRPGQEADELEPVFLHTTAFDHENFWACLIDALYVAQTTGIRHKAVYAGYNPMPRKFPLDLLRERGFVDLPQLDDKLRASLEEKFGKLE